MLSNANNSPTPEMRKCNIFTYIFTNKDPDFLNKSYRIEVIDKSTNKIIYLSDILRDSVVRVEFDGPKYDNRLFYRYLNPGSEGTSKQFTPLHEGGIAMALNRLDPGTSKKYDLQVLDGIDSTEAIYLMRNILMRGYRRILLRPEDDMLRRYDEFLRRIPKSFLSKFSVVEYVHQVLWILLKYVMRCTQRSIPIEAVSEAVADRMIVNYLHSFTDATYQPTQKAGLLVSKGHLMSLSDRGKASDCYQDARAAGSGFIENFLRVDALTTYYNDIPVGLSPGIVPSEIPVGYRNNSRNICFSVDPKYFKMYGPLWASTSAFYPSINFNYLIVTETYEEFTTLAAQYLSLLESTYAFVGQNSVSNVRLFWMKNDKGYGRTLYACARFFLTQHLLENTRGDVFVCDIDQLVVADLDSFLASTSRAEADVQLALVENYYALLPGRSHLAGYIYLKNTDRSREFIQNVTNYIGHGLGRNYSWMLDQNAIRYAAETTPVCHLNMRSVKVFGHYGSHKDALRAKLPEIEPSRN